METFLDLKDELESHGRLSSIPNVDGIYKVYLPENFHVVICDRTDAITSFRGKSLLYSVSQLETKWQTLCQQNNGSPDSRLLYIGKATCSIGRGLQKRITELVKYGYGKCNTHRGGRALWQLENNKLLLLETVECSSPEQTEKELLGKYKEQFGLYPFANWRL